MTDDELRALVAGLAVSQAETEKLMKENALRMKQTDEQMKRTDEQLKRTDEQLKCTNEQLKRTDEQLKRTDEKLDRIGITLGNMGKNQGDVAEEFFYNSLLEPLQLGDIHFDDITKNMEKYRGKVHEEYDLVLTNGEAVAVIEVKYKAHINDLKKLARKLLNFKRLFPVYNDYKLYGGFASFHINEDVMDAALDKGYFVLQRSGNVMTTISKQLQIS